MRWKNSLCSMGLSLALAANSAWAGDNWCCPPAPYGQPGMPSVPLQPGQPGYQGMPGQPGAQQPGQPGAQTPESQLAQAQAAGTGAEGTANPNVMGDFLGGSAPANLLKVQQSSGSFSSFTSQSGSSRGNTDVPVRGGGEFKICENENVLPMDRWFIGTNYYQSVFPGLNKRTLVPGRVDDYAQTIGFESTVLGGNGSFGVRVPFFEITGGAIREEERIGDVSLIAKFLLTGDPASGTALSAGLDLTLPTGLQATAIDGHKIESFVFQPFLGFTGPLGSDFYYEGFTSLALPTCAEDSTIYFFDIAFGYWAYRGGAGLISGVVPVGEIHVNWTLTNGSEHDSTHSINTPSSIDLTGGVHILFGPFATLQLGLAFPITGPNPFDVELLAQLNFRF